MVRGLYASRRVASHRVESVRNPCYAYTPAGCADSGAREDRDAGGKVGREAETGGDLAEMVVLGTALGFLGPVTWSLLSELDKARVTRPALLLNRFFAPCNCTTTILSLS